MRSRGSTPLVRQGLQETGEQVFLVLGEWGSLGHNPRNIGVHINVVEAVFRADDPVHAAAPRFAHRVAAPLAPWTAWPAESVTEPVSTPTCTSAALADAAPSAQIPETAAASTKLRRMFLRIVE